MLRRYGAIEHCSKFVLMHRHAAPRHNTHCELHAEDVARRRCTATTHDGFAQDVASPTQQHGTKKAALPFPFLLKNYSPFAMKIVTFCAFVATLAALAMSAPLLSDADPTLMESDDTTLSLESGDEPTLMESDDTLSLEESFVSAVFCPNDYKTDGLTSIAALRVRHAQMVANAHCGFAKARTSIESIKYDHVVSLFKQNNQRTTWRTQAQVDEQKRNLDAAKVEETKKCLCKGGSTTEEQEKSNAANPPSYRESTENYDYSKSTDQFCPADFSTAGLTWSQGISIRSKQLTANSNCNIAHSLVRLQQSQYNMQWRRLSNANPALRPTPSQMAQAKAHLDEEIAKMEKACECSNVATERAALEASAQAAVNQMVAAQNQAVAEAKSSADAKDLAEAQAQADGYPSVQGKIDAWNKATAEAVAAAKKSAAAKAAEVAQRNAQAAAEKNAKAAALAKATEQAKADAIAKATSQAKLAAEAKAAAEAQAAADKAAADVWRTETASSPQITAQASATVTSVATATASNVQGTASATESASSSVAVVKSGAAENASATESASDTKTATASATAEFSATESVTQSASATRTAPGTKVHFSCKA